MHTVVTAALATAGLLLWAVLPLLIHPTVKKNRNHVLAFTTMVTIAAATAATFALSPWPAVAAIPLAVYAGALAFWTGQALQARRDHNHAKAEAVANGWIARDPR